MSKNHSDQSSWVVIPVIALFLLMCMGGAGYFFYVRARHMSTLVEQMRMEAMVSEKRARQQAEMARHQAMIAQQRAEAALLQMEQMRHRESVDAAASPDERLLPPLESLPQ